MTPGDLAEILERIEAKQDWCVSALKQLLALEAGIELPESAEEMEAELDEAWLSHVPLNGHAVEDDPNEHIAVRTRPQPKAKACPHNQQVLVDNQIQCARCGAVLTASGVQQNRVTSDGRVVADPNPPQWATEYSRGASSKNPGTSLVPHSS